MRVLILVAIIALLIFTFVNYLYYSNRVVFQYNKAHKLAGDSGAEAAMDEYEKFRNSGSWTSIFLIPKLEDQWLDDLGDFAVSRAESNPVLLVDPAGTCAADYLAWIEKKRPNWPKMPDLVNRLAKATFEKSKEYVNTPPEIMITEINNEKQLVKFARLLAKSEHLPEDNRLRLTRTADSLAARIPADEKRFKEYMDSLPKR